ncbi:hypothetical protein [Actinomadura nitritigenes]|uniref:hypothetical protein n=1 Tax=Actinomadura nitritigenes TaxID=134602 RepID=UPI003D8E6AD0
MDRAFEERQISVLQEALTERDREISRLQVIVRALAKRPDAAAPAPDTFTAAVHSALTATSPSRQRAVWLPVTDDLPPALCVVQGGEADTAAETAIWHWLNANGAAAATAPIRDAIRFESDDLPPRLLAAVLANGSARISSQLSGARARQVRDIARRAYRSRYRGVAIWGLITGALLFGLREVERLVSAVSPSAFATVAATTTISTAAAAIAIGIMPPAAHKPPELLPTHSPDPDSEPTTPSAEVTTRTPTPTPHWVSPSPKRSASPTPQPTRPQKTPAPSPTRTATASPPASTPPVTGTPTPPPQQTRPPSGGGAAPQEPPAGMDAPAAGAPASPTPFRAPIHPFLSPSPQNFVTIVLDGTAPPIGSGTPERHDTPSAPQPHEEAAPRWPTPRNAAGPGGSVTEHPTADGLPPYATTTGTHSTRNKQHWTTAGTRNPRFAGPGRHGMTQRKVRHR